jgi:hypothetical protein
MKQLFVVTLMVLLPLAAMAQAQHLKFKQSGEFASVFLTPDNLSATSLSVSTITNSTSGSSTSIAFQTFTVAADFSSESFTQIFGEIPDSAFTGHNTQHLVLDLDTSTLDPNVSFAISCTVDLINLTPPVCGPVPPGLIHVEFQENGVQRTQVLNFDEVITLGDTTTRIHQKSDNSSANAQGTILGVSVAGGSATVGVNHNSTLEIIKP